MDDREIAHGYNKNDDLLSNSDRPQLLSNNNEIHKHIILNSKLSVCQRKVLPSNWDRMCFI